jgi:hypothetical protein
MRGADGYNEALFSTVRLEDFVPATHPLRPIRKWNNEAQAKMDEKFSAIYEADSKGGRPSIAPERRMRAMLLQASTAAEPTDVTTVAADHARASRLLAARHRHGG